MSGTLAASTQASQCYNSSVSEAIAWRARCFLKYKGARMISTTKLSAATQLAARLAYRLDGPGAGVGVVGAVVLAVAVLAPSRAQAQDDYQGAYYGAGANDQYGGAPVQ